MPRVLNLLTSGGVGGIEVLCEDIAANSKLEQGFCFLFSKGAVYDRMTKRGMTTYDLSNFSGKISWGRFRRLCRIAKDYDVVVVHHGDAFLKLYFTALVRHTGLPGVVMIHSCWEEADFYPDSPMKKRMGKRFFQSAMDAAKAVVFVSKAGRRTYEETFQIQQDKACVIYNGIGMHKLEAGKDNVCAGKAPYHITFVGRLEAIKGVELLLQAAKNLRDKYAFTVTIIGDGGDRERLEKMAADEQLQDIVSFEGRQMDIIPYLQNTDISVCCSVCQEVFGISMVEAMAFGIVCVANNVGGIPEIVEDGVNGFLNMTNDAQGLTETLEKAILSYENGSYRELATKAKERAAELTIENNVEQLDKLYCDIL